MIDSALQPPVAERARAVAAAMAQENGVDVTVRAIEELTHHP